MSTTNNPERYNPLSIGLHWLMLLMLVAVYACIELRVFFPKGSDPREMLKAWHFMLGLSIMLLVFIRIAVRFIYPAPPAAATQGWQKWFAKFMHLALYGLMVGLPLLGWLYLSAKGKVIPFFGLELPALVSANPELVETFEELHETGGTLGYFLIGLHAAAALFHHYVVKDKTLQRMTPAWSK